MGHRGWGVPTSTAQMHIIGKRHFGLKALPTRRRRRGAVDPRTVRHAARLERKDTRRCKREVTVEVPLNDSITSFRIVAVATGELTCSVPGSTSIRVDPGVDAVLRDRAARPGRGQDLLRTSRSGTRPSRSSRREVTGRVTELGSLCPPKSWIWAPGESRNWAGT